MAMNLSLFSFKVLKHYGDEHRRDRGTFPLAEESTHLEEHKTNPCLPACFCCSPERIANPRGVKGNTTANVEKLRYIPTALCSEGAHMLPFYVDNVRKWSSIPLPCNLTMPVGLATPGKNTMK